MDVYKIKNESGKFSNGKAGNIKWTKTGKSFDTIGKIRTHLFALYYRDDLDVYANCSVVKFSMVENGIVEDIGNMAQDVKLRGFYEKFKTTKSNYGRM